MNFQPELAEKVMRGEKTVTRRLPSDKPRSPWYIGRCALRAGRDYAVCPGRGKPAVGRVVVKRVRMERLGYITEEEAVREGFEDVEEFTEAWAAINGTYDPEVLVWRVEFKVVGIEAEEVAA